MPQAIEYSTHSSRLPPPPGYEIVLHFMQVGSSSREDSSSGRLTTKVSFRNPATIPRALSRVSRWPSPTPSSSWYS